LKYRVQAGMMGVSADDWDEVPLRRLSFRVEESQWSR
jgi:hypothetical protein